MYKFERTIEFELKDTVKFRNRIGSDEGIITSIQFCVDGGVLYHVVWSNKEDKSHYACELELKQKHG